MKNDNLRNLKEKALAFVPVEKHDAFVLEVIKEACTAAERGNFGIGAILVNDDTGEIVCRGQNKVFSRSRSDLHAEMDLLDKFEDMFEDKSREMIKKMTLYTSLEPCPMCTCRIITSGVGRIYHAANDETGGMVHLRDQLPSVWQDISKDRVFENADCSTDLSEIAEQVFLATLELNDKL